MKAKTQDLTILAGPMVYIVLIVLMQMAFVYQAFGSLVFAIFVIPAMLAGPTAAARTDARGKSRTGKNFHEILLMNLVYICAVMATVPTVIWLLLRFLK